MRLLDRRRFLGASAAALGAAITPLSVPSGFGWTPSWTFSRIGAGASSTFASSFNFDSTKPTPNADLYVDPIAGNNANAGTSRGASLRSASSAVTAANALAVASVRLLLRPDIFWRYKTSTLNDHFNAVAPTCDLIIEPDTFYGSGDAYVIGNHAATVAFSVFSGNIYKATASVGTSSNRNCVDLVNKDARNAPIGLKRVMNPVSTADPSSEINAAWAEGRGAYFYNSANGDLFVRMVDDRAPDANFVLCTGAANMFTVSNAASRKIWMDRIHNIGGSRAIVIGGSGVTHEVYARQSSFVAASDNSGGGCVTWVNGAGLLVLDRCSANDGLLDGVNGHGTATTGNVSPNILEIDLVSRRCGSALGGANNASTAHEQTKVISVNGIYETAQDRVIHDIDTAQRWMMGSTINAPIDTTSASGLIRCGSAVGDATKHWYDAVRFGAISGSQFHIDVTAAAAAKYANMNPAGWVTPGAGSIATYTP